jgi:hypothetical protein
VKIETLKVETQKPAPVAAKPAAPVATDAPASEKKAVDTPAAKAPVTVTEKAPVKAAEKPAAPAAAKVDAPAKVEAKVAPKVAEKPAAKVEAKLVAKAAPKAAAKAAPAPATAKAKPAVAEAKPVAAAKPAAEKSKAAKPARPALEDFIPEAPASAFSFPPAFNEKSLPRPETIAAPFATIMEIGAETARKSFEQAQGTNESMRQACLESANAASRGMVALNTQMLDLVRAQTDATLGLWRSALAAPSFSEAVKVQTSGARQAYETTAAHLKVIAETTTRVVGETTKPIQTALNDRSR